METNNIDYSQEIFGESAELNDVEDWHNQLLTNNTEAAISATRQKLQIIELEAFCKAKEKIISDLKIQYIKAEGLLSLHEQELTFLQKQADILNDSSLYLNEMIISKQYTGEILEKYQSLLYTKDDRHNNEWAKIIAWQERYIQQLRDTYEKKEVVQIYRKLQIKIQMKRIHLATLNQEIIELSDDYKLLRQIRKRQEQLKIIKFVELMMDYHKMESMKEELKTCELQFKEQEQNVKIQHHNEIFKIPTQPLCHKKDYSITTFELPILNLNNYRVRSQPLVSSSSTNEAFPCDYYLNKSLDSNYNVNKRSILYQFKNQKKLKSMFDYNISLPMSQNVNLIKEPEKQYVSENKSKTNICPSKILSQNKCIVNQDTNNTQEQDSSQITQEILMEITENYEQILQERVLSPQNKTTEKYSNSKSPYFELSQIISSGTSHANATVASSQDKNVQEILDDQPSSMVDYQVNEHDLDAVETNSYVSIEEFTSPPEAAIENNCKENTRTFSLSNIFGSATASKTKENNNGFSFLNITPKKNSSKSFFSMF